MKLTIQKLFLLLGILLPLSFTSCSDDDDDNDGVNWKAINEEYFANVRARALDSIALAKRLYGDEWESHSNWNTFLSYKRDPLSNNLPTDSIVTEVIKRGTGTTVPYSSDSCRIFYRGHLIETETYPAGTSYVYAYSGQSSKYEDIFNRNLAIPTLRTVSSYVTGFSTALMNMHAGDRWRVYIPTGLGYGSSTTSAIPAYSTLIFEIELVAFYRKGTSIPSWN